MLMILAYFFLTMAMLNYRIHKASERALQRIHYLLMSLVVILGSIAVHSAAKKKKNPKKNQLHYVLGWTVIGLFLLQFLLGGGSISLIRRNPNHWMVQLHRILGPLIQVGMAAALMDGIIVRCHDLSCGALVISVGLTTLCTALGIVAREPPLYNDAEEAQIIV